MSKVYEHTDGSIFGLGCILGQPLKFSHRPYGSDEHTPMVTENEWEQIAIASNGDQPSAPIMNYIHDQNGYGMCNASATASAMELENLKATGDYDKLSAGDLYNRISGGSDNGSTLEDGLMEGRNGIASISEVPYLEWRRRSAGTTRKNAQVLEWYLASSFAECYSGVCRGFSLITGIMWYDNFDPDSKGRLPSRGRGQPGGHAIHGYKPGWIDGKPYIWHKNSWTTRYGLAGHMAIGREHYDGDIGGWWLVRLVTAPVTGDKLPTPVL